MYFAEKGRVVPAREYKYATDRPKLLNMKEIVKAMGSYTTAIHWIEKYEPELWNTIHGKVEEPKKVEVKVEAKVETETEKADPLAALSKLSTKDG
jgi:hypothetical protein